MNTIKTLHELLNKKVAILGFGIEGKSALSYLLKHGADSLTVFDERDELAFSQKEINELKKQGVEFRFGQFADLIDFDIIVRSPGIHVEHDQLREAREAKVTITSPTKLFFDLVNTKNIIGVTGTKGKGTTSTLIYEMLKKQGYKVFLGGNIGTPPLDFLNQVTPDSWVILELSSFQLHDLHKSPHIAVMLMVTSEHLDYHKDVYEYVEAKRTIVRFQTRDDFAVLNWDYPATHESDIHTEAKIYKVSRDQEVDIGCSVINGSVYLKTPDGNHKVVSAKDIKLPGKHNWENVCAATVAAHLASVDLKNIASVIKSFAGLPHRLELIKTVKGVRYYNDSFSTTPETAMAAIESFDEPKILVLGGSSKGSDFTALGQLISEDSTIKAIIGIGDEWNQIKPLITKPTLPIIEGKKSMREIVEAAQEIAQLGDIVLLSPACASFGMFTNYKDRGEQFRREVEELAHTTQN